MHALGVLYPTARRTSGAEVAGDLDRSSPTDLSNAAFSVLASWSPGHAPLRRDPRSAAPPPRPPAPEEGARPHFPLYLARGAAVPQALAEGTGVRTSLGSLQRGAARGPRAVRAEGQLTCFLGYAGGNHLAQRRASVSPSFRPWGHTLRRGPPPGPSPVTIMLGGVGSSPPCLRPGPNARATVCRGSPGHLRAGGPHWLTCLYPGAPVGGS